ncbi:MAG: T9SS C-terminal target domain-containing protein [Ignavibacteriae bacterium]|nr:MAG: T9SS C-terminal target domain-containing protein [Ignavibacteriota bacterium]
MKYIIIISLFLFSGTVFSQSGWFWQNPLPQGNALSDLKMFNENTGICINADNILRTTNGGDNWQAIYTGFDTYNTSMSMVDENIGYILLDSSKIIKTVNGGVNWSFVAQIDNIITPNLKFISTNIGFIIAGRNIYGGIKLFRTSNGGLTWNTIINDSTINNGKISFLNSVTGYIISVREINYYSLKHLKNLKTTDSGITWDSVQNSINLYSISSAIFVNNSTGFICGSISPSNKILRTTDGGTNWIAVTNGNINFGNFYFIDSNTGFLITQGYIYKTTNNGDNWVQYYYYAEVGNDLNETSFINTNTGIAVGYGGVIAKTINGGINWTKKNNGINSIIWEVQFSDYNTGFAVGLYGYLFKTTNGGINWLTYQFPILDYGGIGKVNSDIWYFPSWDDGKIFKTTNTGLSFDTTYSNAYGITRLKFFNENTGYGVCKYGNFIKTTNGGMNWILVSNTNGAQNWSLDFINENTGFAGGSLFRKTTNAGINWNAVSGMDSMYSADIQFINEYTGFIGGGYYIGYSYHGSVWKTTNGGNSWQKFDICNYSIDDISFVNESVGFAKCGSVIFKTTNGGINWFQLRRTCSYNSLNSLYFVDSLVGYAVGDYGTIIKTTNGGGTPIGIDPISNKVPGKFILYQNYPNPFNPITHIKIEIPSNSNHEMEIVKLVVYDILGREVITLVNEELHPGTYNIEWNASNFSSGVYFYSLKAGDFIETRRMVLIK